MHHAKSKHLTVKKHHDAQHEDLHKSRRHHFDKQESRVHCGMRPSRNLNPEVAAADPLLGKHIYQLHVYDHEAPPPKDGRFYHPHHMHTANWLSGGTIVFHGDGKSITVAGHKINNAKWHSAKSTVSWSNQRGAVPHGTL